MPGHNYSLSHSPLISTHKTPPYLSSPTTSPCLSLSLPSAASKTSTLSTVDYSLSETLSIPTYLFQISNSQETLSQARWRISPIQQMICSLSSIQSHSCQIRSNCRTKYSPSTHQHYSACQTQSRYWSNIPLSAAPIS